MNSIIASEAYIEQNATIGNYCIIHPTAKIAANVVIGDYNVISEFTMINADIGHHNYIESGSTIHSPIGNYNYIGIQAIVNGNLGNNKTIRHRQQVVDDKEQLPHPNVENIENIIKYCSIILPKHLKLKRVN